MNMKNEEVVARLESAIIFLNGFNTPRREHNEEHAKNVALLKTLRDMFQNADFEVCVHINPLYLQEGNE